MSLTLVNETIQSGGDMESNEDEFKDISEQIEQLNRRIAAIQDSLANDMSRQERLEQIQKVIEQREQNSDQYDDSIVRQMIECISQNTISGYLEYISDHDLYRNMHPLYPVQSKKNSPPPMKGTKRYRKEQKRAAKKARRQSIAHVLTLIENLDTQARVARSM